ncbi:MAG TPA: TolC family protein [Candidatus Aquilonibacter sp.]|nr:TolC family protein [Candidatus Aquilonibacter sp.]
MAAGPVNESTESGGSGPSPLSAPSSAQGNFSGSVPSALVPGVLSLSLQDAIDRGLKQNLGLLLSGQDVRAAHGERWKELSALLPNVTANSYVDASQIDLAEFGFSFKFPPSLGFSIPSIVGPFAYFDSRAYLTQSIFDLKAINNTHAATQSAKSAEYTFKDARDLVVLAVGYTYLQAIADEARVDTATAQVATAQALYNQAADQVSAGTSPKIDALRANVELKTRQQALIQATNNFAIAKLTLARVIGLAPGQQYELTDKSPYQPFEGLGVEDALKRAYANRSDYQAALADVRASEFSEKAARDGYLPSLSFSSDYGLAGTYQSLDTHGVMDVRGTLTIPIFQGGKVHGDVLEAQARLEQSRQRLDNLRAQIDDDVRTALLNLQSAEQLVEVARSNIDLADETLTQSRDRFAAGVTDTVEVVQAQEQVASAHEDYISSLYSDNYAKISLARAMGVGEAGVKEYFKGK